ncbi:hypothetical protein [Methanopyrus kandleri]|uniref:Uncharacterized protein n=2 Tax=Methanopyrus kandleri TaxID=2320 RepID=Q8TWX9_METKA|nr:hypothetical protein [Methanopyrus kandleri]AAM02115.1 Uncharacterized protein MK0902 [Methanopyrus kandleri AV19]HII69870.1 hypothetical protein [Methanopyrus kandleri]
MEPGFELKDVFRESPRKRGLRPGRHAFRATFRRDPVYLEYRARCEDPVGDVSELLAERYNTPGDLLDRLQMSSLDLVVPARPYVVRGGRPFAEPEHCDVGFATRGRVLLALVRAVMEAQRGSEDVVHAAATFACAPLLQCTGYRGDEWDCVDELAPVLDAPDSRELSHRERSIIEFADRASLGEKFVRTRAPSVDLYLVEAVGEVEPVAAEFTDYAELSLYRSDSCFLGLLVETPEGVLPADPEELLKAPEDWDVRVAVRGPINPAENPDPLLDRHEMVRLGEERGNLKQPEADVWAGVYRWEGWWKGRRFRPLRSVPMSIARLVWFARRLDLGMVPETLPEEFDVDVEAPTPWEVWIEGDSTDAFEAGCAVAIATGLIMSLNVPVESSEPTSVLHTAEDLEEIIGVRPLREALRKLESGVSIGSTEPVRGVRVKSDDVVLTLSWEDAAHLPWWVTSLSKIGEDVAEKLVERPELIRDPEFVREYVRTALASERHAFKIFRELVEERSPDFASSLLRFAASDPEMSFEVLDWLRDILEGP